jgi:ABC-type transport system involved in cytochrome c biogenesis permease subunit
MLGYGTLGAFQVFRGEYTVNLAMDKSSLPLRVELPMVGPLMTLTLLTIVVAVGLFTLDHFKRDEQARKWGWRLFHGAVVLQGVVLLTLFFQMKNLDNPALHIPAREYPAFSVWMGEQSQQVVTAEQAKTWVQQNSSSLKLTMTSNPVEFGALIGLFVALFLVALFSWKREPLLSALPPLKNIDGLLYRTVGVAFPLLSLLLITGAVWANESWGRYWGWDSKEVGALVAWMAYAGFLHTRIAHGWRGRRSAYFALLGFALVIFTWLGVSFIIPGLHSYAGV